VQYGCRSGGPGVDRPRIGRYRATLDSGAGGSGDYDRGAAAVVFRAADGGSDWLRPTEYLDTATATADRWIPAGGPTPPSPEAGPIDAQSQAAGGLGGFGYR